MKLGITGCLDKLNLLKKLGFDFVEPGAYSVSEMPEDEFKDLQKGLMNNNLPAMAFNMFVPSEIKTTGPDVDNHKIVEYLNKSLYRCKKLGGQAVVYGSGGSRKVPEGFSYDKAWDQLVSYFKIAGDIAKKYDIKIVIEPLYKENTNIINTVAEGLKMCKQVDHPYIRLLADNFHMIEENEEPKVMLDAGSEYLYHIHIRDENFSFPTKKDYTYFKKFFDILKRINYDRGISYEVSVNDLSKSEFEKQAKKSIEFIKSLGK